MNADLVRERLERGIRLLAQLCFFGFSLGCVGLLAVSELKTNEERNDQS